MREAMAFWFAKFAVEVLLFFGVLAMYVMTIFALEFSAWRRRRKRRPTTPTRASTDA
jgi:hypothetical protein